MLGYNFTERVRKVLVGAREEAARLHHDYVGTEHILLGLIREGGGVAARVLKSLSVDLHEMQQTIEDTVKKGKAAETTGPDLPYTSRGKRVLELAMREAMELRHDSVGTEHLLLGLLREEKGIAAQVLTDAGLTLEAARSEIVRLSPPRPSTEGEWPLGGASPTTEPAPSAPPSSSAVPLYWLVDTGPYSGRALSVLSALAEESARKGREDFTPESLVLAILRAGGAARAAVELLADPQRIIRALEAIEHAERAYEPQEGPDASLVRIFAAAAMEQQVIADGAVGTHHILLGILAVYRGAAYQVLTDHGLTHEETRAVVERNSG
jgi:ATP-dependent Clp protease ATP-binding subunit ClpA